MSIASRIQSIEEHVSDAYDGLENLGVDLTDVDKNIENISSMLDEVWDDYAKVTVTDETFANLEGTKKGKMEISLKGNATQADTPTPDTPQDIHVVTGDNTVKVLGKNLLKATNGSTTNRGIKGTISNYNELSYTGTASAAYSNFVASFPLKLKADTTYTFSIDNALGGNARLSLYLSGGTSQTITIAENTTSKTFVANGTNTTAYMALSNLTTNTAYSGNVKMQIEVGSTDTTYEPYTLQTQLLSLGNIELAKIGDYTDRIFKDNGKWYVYKAVGKFVLNGSETITQNSATFENVIRYTIYKAHNVDVMNITSNGTGFNNQLPILNSYDGDSEHLYIYNNVLYMFYDKTKITGLDALYTFLSNNNLIVYGRLTTPTYTEITDTTLIGQLEAMQKIKSNDGTTNVFTEGDGSPFYLDVVALKSAN